MHLDEKLLFQTRSQYWMIMHSLWCLVIEKISLIFKYLLFLKIGVALRIVVVLCKQRPYLKKKATDTVLCF